MTSEEKNYEKQPYDTKVREEGGGGCGPGAGAEIPLQSPGEDHSESDCSPAAHGE